MSKNKYQGAYSRRRFSNATTTSLGSNGNLGSSGSGSQTGTVNVVVSVNNASMGSINATLLPSATNPGQTGTTVTNRDGSKTLTVPRGSTVRVVARAANGYVLQTFTGIPTPPSTPTAAFDVVANTDCNFTAVFRQASATTYNTVTVVYNSKMGQVNTPGLSPEPGYPDSNGVMRASMSVQYGNSVTLTATPKAGYRFVSWEGCVIAGKPNMTVHNSQVVQQIFSDRTLYAVFESEGGNSNGGGGGSSYDSPQGGGGAGGGNVIGNNGNNPVVIDGPGTQGSTGPEANDSFIDKAIPFVKKYWWAIAIALWLYYDSRKGGSR